MLYNNLQIPKVRVATGLYSHWDSIIKVNKNVLMWIKNSKGKKSRNTLLNSIEEVSRDIKEYRDGEFLISKDVYDELDKKFPKREFRLGGNGNNAGRILMELGITPLVSYPIRPEKLMRCSPNFNVAVGNKIKKPRETIRKNDPDYDHIIFESEKWRSIFSWDLMSSKGFFDEDFLKLAFNPKLTDIAIISYAHLILPQYKKKTDELLDFIKNKRSKIHLEFGFGSEESMRYAMEKFAEHKAADSWGMNEKECKFYLKADSESKEDLIEAAQKAIKDYNLKRICVHSPKFVFSVSKYSMEREIEALTAGCLIVGSKISRKPRIKLTGNIVKKKLNSYNICIVPTFFIEHSKKITGMGDVFTAVQCVKILS